MQTRSKKPAARPKSAKAVTNKDDFESVAKRLECDEDRKTFEAKLGKLAKAKPKAAK